MERESGAQIAIVSTGPDRDQTLEMPAFREAMQAIAGK
jgi:adenylosuccinate synthase